MTKLGRLLLALTTGLLAFSTEVRAEETSDALIACISDSTTGKDRVEFFKWMFSNIASHPQIKPMTNITPEFKMTKDRTAANLITRLLTVDCVKETKATMVVNGNSKGIENALSALGQMAMIELMSNPAVKAASSDFGKFLDEKALDEALK